MTVKHTRSETNNEHEQQYTKCTDSCPKYAIKTHTRLWKLNKLNNTRHR